MRVLLCLIGGVLISAALPAQAARLDPEARLAKALEGRVAGKPVDCIPQYRIQSSEIFERTAILYKAGATVAVPETLEASLQLSEAVLVDLGVAMGPVIASIHAKRDEYRETIRESADLLRVGGQELLVRQHADDALRRSRIHRLVLDRRHGQQHALSHDLKRPVTA